MMMCSGTKYSHESFFIHEMFLIFWVVFLFWLFLLGAEVTGTAVSLCFCFQ